MNLIVIENSILDLLVDKQLSALSISKFIYGDKGTKSMVNPLLYGMEKKGLIVHTNTTPPLWSSK